MVKQDLSKSTEFSEIPIPEFIRQATERTSLNKTVICYLQIIGGAISVVIGGLALHYNSPNSSLPFSAGSPVWMGILVIISGLVGVLADRGRSIGKLTSDKSYASILAIVYFTSCVVTTVLCVISTGIQIVGIVSCTFNTLSALFQNCLPNKEENLTTAVLGMITGIALCVVSVLGTYFFCARDGRLLGVTGGLDRTVEQKYKISTVQIE